MAARTNQHAGKRREISNICHQLAAQRYLVAQSGNVSMRTEEGFLITPTSTRKATLRPPQIVSCNARGATLEKGKTPSSEIIMHREVYRSRKDVHAIVHAHPPYALACALAEISLADMSLPELDAYVGPVPIVPFAPPGTEEMYTALKPTLANHQAFLLNRHGVLVLGTTLQEAFDRLEHLEHMAHVAYLTHSMGALELFTKAELKKLGSHARKFGQELSHVLHTLQD